MCAGAHVQVYACGFVFRYTCVVHVGSCVQVHMCRCLHVGTYVQVYVYMYMHMSMCMCRCIHVGTCVYIGKYTCAGICV